VGTFQRGSAKKQAVPKRDEKPIHGLVSDKNFIVANAVENILAGKCHFKVFLPLGESTFCTLWQLLFSDLNLRAPCAACCNKQKSMAVTARGKLLLPFVLPQLELYLILASQFEF
jgi:hypothetical protein